MCHASFLQREEKEEGIGLRDVSSEIKRLYIGKMILGNRVIQPESMCISPYPEVFIGSLISHFTQNSRTDKEISWKKRDETLLLNGNHSIFPLFPLATHPSAATKHTQKILVRFLITLQRRHQGSRTLVRAYRDVLQGESTGVGIKTFGADTRGECPGGRHRSERKRKKEEKRGKKRMKEDERREEKI